MQLAELLDSLNRAGLSLMPDGAVAGPSEKMTPAIAEALREHKPTLLAVLTPAEDEILLNDTGKSSIEELRQRLLDSALRLVAKEERLLARGTQDDYVDEAEKRAIADEANGEIPPDKVTRACLEWDAFVTAHVHNDWRLNWLLELGALFLAYLSLNDANDLGGEKRRLLSLLADQRPANANEWSSAFEPLFAKVQRDLAPPGFFWPGRE